MARSEVVSKMQDLEDTMRQARPISLDFFHELLNDYRACVWMLANDSHPWERAIEIEERCQELDNKGTGITDQEFEEYSFLLVILGSLYERPK